MKQSKLLQRVEAYQGNCYPAMLADLATHLGVSSESLSQLGIGWAPVVEFTKGPNFQGWWTIPERDALGNVTAISLRSCSDFKAMLPGGKRGLVYPINPDHRAGSEGYRHGRQNWTRVYDAGVDCPVCGKGGYDAGCLVSSEDPDDPKAAVCIRVKDGMEKELKFGYLHILKAEGIIDPNASLLPPSDLPILILEGMTDVAAALDLGFIGVGRPNNKMGADLLADLCRGREVLVLGENDKVDPNTGERPGEAGMHLIFEVVARTAGRARYCLPPVDVKDLRTWKQRYPHVTPEDILAHAEKHGSARSHDIILPDGQWDTVASRFLADTFKAGEHNTLAYWRQGWYVYNNTCYRQETTETLHKFLYDWAKGKQVAKPNGNGGGGFTPLPDGLSYISNMENKLRAETEMTGNQHGHQWVRGVSGPDAKHLVVFDNGVLDMARYAEDPQSECFYEPSPALFTTLNLPYNYDPSAKCPHWERYVADVFSNEPERALVLQEWFGYCLTPNNSLSRMLYLMGPPGSGKSVCLTMLSDMIGEEQSTAISLDEMAGQFGLDKLRGKLLAVVGDLSIPTGHTGRVVLERLKNITGGDKVGINRKHKDATDERLACRLAVASNEPPFLPDSAGAMARRLLVIEFDRVFKDEFAVAGRDYDPYLEEKLKAELPGIVNWSLQGYVRLLAQGDFTSLESMRAIATEVKHLNSPIHAFFDDCTQFVSAEVEVPVNELYETWRGWCEANDIRPGMVRRFLANIKAQVKQARPATYHIEGKTRKVVKGVRLLPEAQKMYLGKPV